jgi:hypothetical protein
MQVWAENPNGTLPSRKQTLTLKSCKQQMCGCLEIMREVRFADYCGISITVMVGLATNRQIQIQILKEI